MDELGSSGNNRKLPQPSSRTGALRRQRTPKRRPGRRGGEGHQMRRQFGTGGFGVAPTGGTARKRGRKRWTNHPTPPTQPTTPRYVSARLPPPRLAPTAHPQWPSPPQPSDTSFACTSGDAGCNTACLNEVPADAAAAAAAAMAGLVAEEMVLVRLGPHPPTTPRSCARGPMDTRLHSTHSRPRQHDGGGGR